jgi:perosamine synthetase
MIYQDKYKEIYKESFRKFLGSDEYHIGLFWKGRVALYALLKSLDLNEGDEIILPAFTCVAVSAPITYLKLKPVYVDIDFRTYNINPQLIERYITKKTRVIIVQNTFGLSSDLNPILETAKQYNIIVIEDCSHGIGSKYESKINGTFTGYAFYSTQWNKMYSTGIGGITATRNPVIKDKLEQLQNSAVEPGVLEKLSLMGLTNFRKMLNPENYFFLQDTYRLLSRYNLVVGSNQGEEFKEVTEPENYLKGISNFQAHLGVNALASIQDNINHRKYVAENYYRMFSEIGFELYYPEKKYDHVFIKFSFLVKDKSKLLKLAAEDKLEMSDWFLSPVHDIIRNIEQWGYRWGSNPVAEEISRHIVNLPTHQGINEDYLNRMSKFLYKNKDMIFENRNLESVK